MGTLRREDIYDCLDDDEAFASLPAQVAQLIGARSAVFHWRSSSGSPLVLADSGYWSPEHMAEYVNQFAEHDIWAQSTLTKQTENRLWAIDDLVPAATYKNSVFYNDWIKSMGDDTYHCAGMSMAGRSGTGLIGLHRAKSRGAFEAQDLAVLSEQIAPLQRLFRARAMLAEARAESGLLAAALDHLSLNIFVVDADRRVVHMNRPAQQRLAEGDPFAIDNGRLSSLSVRNAGLIAAAIAKASCSQSPEMTLTDIYGANGKAQPLTVIPVLRWGRRRVMLMLRPTKGADLAMRLQQAFGLTPSEVQIAIALEQGKSSAEIAAERGRSVFTVRTQIKVIAEKMGCHRQAEIVMKIARMMSLSDPA